MKLYCLAAFIAVLSMAPAVAAQESAEELFYRGRELAAKGDYQAACPLFERSLALDPGIGTKYNLADCYDRVGRSASAHRLFLDVAATARQTGQNEHEQVARDRAQQLAPRVSHLRVHVTRPMRGLTVSADGTAIAAERWEAIDPGAHRIDAAAPGARAWRTEVEVPPNGARIELTVPALAPLSRPAPPDSPAEERESPPALLIAGSAIGAVGLVGVAVGAGFGFDAMAKDDEAESNYCPQPNRCTDEGIALDEKAQRSATIANIGIFGGGALVAAGAIMLIVYGVRGSDAGDGIAFDRTLRFRW